MNTIAMVHSQINYTNWQNLYVLKFKGMPKFYNLILTLVRFSVKFSHNSDLTLFHLKVLDAGSCYKNSNLAWGERESVGVGNVMVAH